VGPTGKRGRGRPRKNPQFDEDGYNASGKLDPTGEMFLRAETRTGGPADPIHGFDDAVKLLFGEKYTDPSEHPLYSYLSSFGFNRTPQGPAGEMKPEEEATIA